MSGDDEYLALLRETLPSDDDKARARARLAALGVTIAVSGASAQASASVLSLSLLGKLFVAAGGVAALSFALVTANEPPRASAPRPVARIEKVTEAVAAPAVEPVEVAPVVKSPVKVKRVRKPEPTPERSADTLAAENALLTLAVRALHEGDSERARQLLDEHAATYPNGLLASERERARAKLHAD